MMLARKIRPKKLEFVYGQKEAVEVLQSYIDNNKVPQAILFSGPSGCGKTTLARILRKHLNCGDGSYKEINCADFRGIDTVREIRPQLSRHILDGDSRIFLIDEAHKLTNDAQNAFLKVLEEPPPNVYFFFCTTDEDKLIKAIMTRLAKIRVSHLDPKSMEQMLLRIAEKLGKEISETVCDKIFEAADGSAREAINILEKVIDLKGEERQIGAIMFTQTGREKIYEIFKLLMNPRTQWNEAARIIKEVKEEPEQVRHYVLACCRNIMAGGGKGSARANLIIQSFRDAWYDCKETGLWTSCYEIICAPKR